MKRFKTIFALFASLLLLGVACEPLENFNKPIEPRKSFFKYYVGPQSDVYLHRPDQYMALFPEICSIDYGDNVYSYLERPRTDAYYIHANDDCSVLKLTLGVNCLTRGLNEQAEYEDGTGQLYMYLVCEIPDEDCDLMLNSGSYPATLKLAPSIWENGQNEVVESLNLEDYPCTLVVDEVAPMLEPSNAHRSYFKMRVKAHVSEEDVNGAPLSVGFNIKFLGRY